MSNTLNTITRTPVHEKAKQIASLLASEQPNYDYLREIFRHLRKELAIIVPKKEKKLRYVPTEEEVSQFYATIWEKNNIKDSVIIRTLLYTGVRVSEFVRILITDVDLKKCQIRIQGLHNQERMVPFPKLFKETLENQMQETLKKGGRYLFESSWKKPYTDRGIRKLLATYSKKSGIPTSISPNTLRTFLFAWLKKQGIENVMIRPYSGHEYSSSLDAYEASEKFSIKEAQEEYQATIQKLLI